MKQNNSLLYFIAFTISLLFIQACRDDDRDLLPPESNPQGQAIFTLNVPKKKRHRNPCDGRRTGRRHHPHDIPRIRNYQ